MKIEDLRKSLRSVIFSAGVLKLICRVPVRLAHSLERDVPYIVNQKFSTDLFQGFIGQFCRPGQCRFSPLHETKVL